MSRPRKPTPEELAQKRRERAAHAENYRKMRAEANQRRDMFAIELDLLCKRFGMRLHRTAGMWINMSPDPIEGDEPGSDFK